MPAPTKPHRRAGVEMATRPSELVYAVDERPPWPQLVVLGLQHTSLICVYLVLIPIIARAAKAPHDVMLDAISLGMIALAIAAVLQALRAGPLGSGYLAVPVYSAIYLGPAVMAAKAGGLPAVFGMTIFAGAVEIGLSCILRRLRPLFPPAVSGFTVAIVGIELGLVGMDQTLGVEIHGRPDFPYHVGVALLTLSISIALSIWGRGAVRLVCSLTGLVSGFTAALLLGLIPAPELQTMASAPLLALPGLAHLAYGFEPELIPAFAAAGVAAALRTIGVVTTCEKINDAGWKRPDLRPIQGGVLADGTGCVVGGLLGAPGMSVGPSLVGVSKATGATSRYIAYACGAILVVLAFVPKAAAIFLAIPLSVAGGMLVFTGALMIAGGIQIMVSRNIDTRMTFVIGISILLALSRKVFPAYFEELPSFLHSLAASSLALGIAAAVGLTLLFRLGIRRHEAIVLAQSDGALANLAAFLEAQGKSWKIDQDVVERAASSAAQAFVHIKEAHLLEGPITMAATYDDVDLLVELAYDGSLLSLPDPGGMSRHFDEEEPFSYGLTLFLSGVYPDRVEASSKGRLTRLRLYFAT
jgi:NCS2 family nucleobase:cation symporter-2